MSGNFIIQLEYLLRLLIAGACGSAIGYERKNRMKEAGIRTHFIVAIGATLIMIVSKYGFQDQIGWQNISIDPSRIAAQVVTGVGFLGAGIIFMKKQSIRGLTTAAGIWATAGIGLAIGSGLYIVGLEATIIIILGQILLHGKIKCLASTITVMINLQILDEPGAVRNIKKIFENEKITVINFMTKNNKEDSKLLDLKIVIRENESFNNMELICVLQENPVVKSVEL
ncbi:MgtC/SapB family protein [Clostridium akagii]|uniref:MgtC/SapB family protein n=1 Tax=Clostridium akagii TaxID=91623 RepID=UPI00047A4F89|nr:MgtC/SapB family protein [Clostridium akagii]